MGRRGTDAEPSLNQLRYFAVVVEEGSFTRAGIRLSLSQPALSRQIALLERRLRLELVERSAVRVIPTPAGRALLPEIRAMLSLSDRIARTADAIGQLKIGALRIGTFASLVTGSLLPAIRRWYTEHPGIQLELSEFQHRNAIQEAARVGAVDIAIGSPPTDWTGPELRVGWEELVVVLPERDPLCKVSGTVELKELAKRHWVLYDRSHGLSDVMAMACLQAGFRPSGVIMTSQAEAAARLAAAGIGPSLVPHSNVPPELSRFARRLSPAVVWELVAFTRFRWPAMAAAFLKIVADENPRPPPADAIYWKKRTNR